MNDKKKLTRSQDEHMIAGVCGGIGEYLDLDPTIVRLLFILLFFLGGNGLLIYLILLIIMPIETTTTVNQDLPSSTEDEA